RHYTSFTTSGRNDWPASKMSASPERSSWFGTQAAKRKRLPWLAIGGALIALLALAAVLTKREPVYQGKPVSFWIAGLAAHDARNQEVLADMGSSAVPYVVRALKSEEGGVIKSIELGWHRLWIRLPGPLQRLLPNPTLRTGIDRRDLIYVLRAMGPAAEPAVPVLAQELKDSDSNYRIAVVRALGQVGRNKPGRTVPILVGSLADAAGNV